MFKFLKLLRATVVLGGYGYVAWRAWSTFNAKQSASAPTNAASSGPSVVVSRSTPDLTTAPVPTSTKVGAAASANN